MDLTPEEFSHSYLMPRKYFENIPQKFFDEHKFNHTFKDSVPSAPQWDPHCRTGIYNQGQCGSCWSFSATEQIETMACLQGHTGGQARSLSMQQIVDCDHNQVDGCGGGSTWSAYDYVISQGGIDNFSCYPYRADQGACRYNGGCVGARINGWGFVGRGNEGEMHNYLFNTGPISVCVCASQWQYYHSGAVMASQCCDAVDHCVQIIGFNDISGVQCWQVRNEWGASWGMDGLIYLQYGANTCNVASFPTTVGTTVV